LHLGVWCYQESHELAFDIKDLHRIHLRFQTFFTFLNHSQKVLNLLSFSLKFFNKIFLAYFVLNKRFLYLLFYHHECRYISIDQSFSFLSLQSLYLLILKLSLDHLWLLVLLRLFKILYHLQHFSLFLIITFKLQLYLIDLIPIHL
jgi:hypothetical protein